jgi:hypothetical protein
MMVRPVLAQSVSGGTRPTPMASQDLPMLRAALEGRPSNEVRKDFRENTRTRRYGRMKTGMRSKSFGEGIFDAELDDAINRRLRR